jgi:hypothetical protein
MHTLSPNVRAYDRVALAVEDHLRDMEADGYGELIVDIEDDGVALIFGTVHVRADNYDIALVRLAGALLNDRHVGSTFMERLRGSDLLTR